jgi:hypothetical protein
MPASESGFNTPQSSVLPESTLASKGSGSSQGEGDTAGDIGVPAVPPEITSAIDDCQAFLNYLDATILLPIQRCIAEGIACIEDCDATVQYSIRDAIIAAEARRQKLDNKCQEQVAVKLATLYATVIPMGYEVPTRDQLFPPSQVEIPTYAPPQFGQTLEPVTQEGVQTPSEANVPSAFRPWPEFPQVPAPPPQRPQQPVRPTHPVQAEPTPPPGSQPEFPGPPKFKPGSREDLERQRQLQELPSKLHAPQQDMLRPLPPTRPEVRPPQERPQPTMPVSTPQTAAIQAAKTAIGTIAIQPDLGPMGNLLLNPDRPDEDSRAIQYFGDRMSTIINADSEESIVSLRDTRSVDSREPSTPFDLIPQQAK